MPNEIKQKDAKATLKLRSNTRSKTMLWLELEKQIAGSPLCDLHQAHKNIVFGNGNKNAEVMLVGEAPGFYEDLEGMPFVGKSGKLLNSWLKLMRLKRDAIYITNILKCRPPNNRTPTPKEIRISLPYVKREIDLVQPKLIIALGVIAAHALLNTREPINKLRGQINYYGEKEIPVFVAYHPAYLLRYSNEKSEANKDFLTIETFIDKIKNKNNDAE